MAARDSGCRQRANLLMPCQAPQQNSRQHLTFALLPSPFAGLAPATSTLPMSASIQLIVIALVASLLAADSCAAATGPGPLAPQRSCKAFSFYVLVTAARVHASSPVARPASSCLSHVVLAFHVKQVDVARIVMQSWRITNTTLQGQPRATSPLTTPWGTKRPTTNTTRACAGGCTMCARRGGCSTCDDDNDDKERKETQKENTQTHMKAAASLPQPRADHARGCARVIHRCRSPAHRPTPPPARAPCCRGCRPSSRRSRPSRNSCGAL